MRLLPLLSIILLLSIAGDKSPLESPLELFFKLYQSRTLARMSIVPGFSDSKTALGEYHRILDRIKIAERIVDDPIMLELVELHELGHMILRRKHDERPLKEDKCPQSLMYYKVDKECYIRYKDEYQKELFENGKWKIQ